jgi:hypothetical protein
VDKLRDLHNKAMYLAEKASIARFKGHSEEADKLFGEAFENEYKATQFLKDKIDAEPTRAVLFRSAASLALDCRKYRDAEQLIAIALSGNPPSEIADELRDLFEQINFQRHLDLHGIELSPNEFQMSIAGNAVGYGIAQNDEVTNRLRIAEALIFRTAERKKGKKYREGGKLEKDIRESLKVYVSLPRAASFALTVRLSHEKQEDITGYEFYYKDIIKEILACLDLFNEANFTALKQRIEDDAYYANFVALSKDIAPDGDRVKVVGFTSTQDNVERRVAITKTRSEIASFTMPPEKLVHETEKTIRGQLKFADSTDAKKNIIKLIDEHNQKHRIIVPEGLMSDIVKPLWEDIVVVKGTMHGKNMILEDIKKAED